LLINTSKTIVHWLNSLQMQGSASAVPTSDWPAIAQAVQRLWRIGGVFVAPSGGRLIRIISSAPLSSAINGYTYATSPGCWPLPSATWKGI
jgi:hypothetical protein